jgi:hypothetical protein
MASKWIHYTPSVNVPQSPWTYNAEQTSKRTVLDLYFYYHKHLFQSKYALYELLLIFHSLGNSNARGTLPASWHRLVLIRHLLQKPNPRQIIACNPIIHLPRYNVLFCTHCRSAMPAGQLRSHLVVSHQLPASIREPII